MSVKAVMGQCVMPKEMFFGTAWPHEQCIIGEDTLELVVSPLSQRNNAVQIHMAAMWNKEVLTFHDLNAGMKKENVKLYLQSLSERLRAIVEKYFMWPDDDVHNMTISFGSLTERKEDDDPLETNMRFVLMVKDILPIEDPTELDMIHKSLKGEFSNWLEEVISDVHQKKSVEELKKDPTVVLDVDLMKHEQEDLGLESTFAIFSLVFAGLGILWKDWFIFQVIAIVMGGYVAYRSYQKQRWVCMVLGLIASIVGIVFTGIAYGVLREQMKNVKLPN
ncbi:MAG: hypothetical protein II483_09520 [Lachnospiraceae bacterium]|nr:hypothetical protein [Lachnospiraceae bacterium]MBQ2032430.1 hypothetical protein [Lachnospiraceae bacterium]MCR5375788.1 hypothetical protein [Lachnospiraceae bacterium]